MANNEDRLIARVVAAVKSWLEQRNIGGGGGGDPRDLDGDGRVTRRERTAAKRADRLAKREARKARRDSGLLPGMTRAQTADFRRMEKAQADRDAQQNNKPQPPPPAPPGANVANQAAPNFADQLRAQWARERKDMAEIEAALKEARSSADTDVNDGAIGVIGDVGLQGVAGAEGDKNIITNPSSEKSTGKTTNLNPQPGFVTVRAENEDGKRKCFGVLGYEASDCGDGPAVRTVWWEPDFGFGTGTGVGVGTGLGTGDGPPSVSIAKGFNLVPSTNTYGEHHPETLWKAIFTAANGTHELTPGATNYLWVKITYSEREVLVADELWQSGGIENYDIDFDFDFDFEFNVSGDFTGAGTGAGTGTGIATVHGGLDCDGGGGGSGGSGSGTGGCECCDEDVTGLAYFTGDNEMLVPVYTDVYGEFYGTGAGSGSGSGSGTGYTYKPEVFDGSIKQYMLHTSSAPVVVTPITTSSTAPADTKTVKHQFLGSVTLNDKGEITEWEWRLNHAFYWNAPDFVAGSYGKTEKSPPPNYDPPDIS